jgi:hypothetical protein
MNQVQLTRPITQGINPRNSAAQFNNAYASALAAGDPRYTIKNYDRAGMSRGGSQMNQAGIDAAQNLAEGIAQAYSQDAQNAQFNANTLLQAQQAQEGMAQNLAGFNSNQAYADQMRRLQDQQASMGILGNLLGGRGNALPDPAAQLQAMRQADNAGGLLGALLR